MRRPWPALGSSATGDKIKKRTISWGGGGSKGRRRLRLTSTFCRPKGLPRPVMGQLLKVKEYNVMTTMMIILMMMMLIIIIVPISKARNLCDRKVRLVLLGNLFLCRMYM
jgi:hypothetical protein